MAADSLEAAFASFRQEYNSLTTQLQDSSVFDDPKKAADLARRHRNLGELQAVFDEQQKVQQEIAENTELSTTEEGELREMAKLELASLQERLPALQQQLDDLLIPSDPDESKNAMLE